MPTRAVLLDCDPGVDDAFALLALPSLLRAAAADLRLVTVVGGNVPLHDVWSNAHFVTSVAGFDVPIVAGRSTPLAGDVRARAHEFHGPRGLGTVERDDVPLPEGGTRAAVAMAQQADELTSQGRRVAILATGPLSNLAEAVAAEPRLVELVDTVVVMGGAFGDPGGNVTPFAEFNFHADPVAVEVVLRHFGGVRIVPLDATERVELTDDDVADLDARLAGDAHGVIVRRLARDAVALEEAASGRRAAILHDAVAALALLRPELFRYEQVPVAVTTHGERAGHVAIAAGGHPATVVSVPDAGAVGAALRDALVGEG